MRQAQRRRASALRPGRGTRAALLVAALVADGAPSPASAQARLPPTIETHTGPWYEPGAPRGGVVWQPGDPGVPVTLTGRALDTAGRPLGGALVEFWHTDANGAYPPLRGAVVADGAGAFRLRTVYPGHNRGWRARHIHFVVTHPAMRPLVTRIYFSNDKQLAAADWPELAVHVEESQADGQLRLFGDLRFVLRPADGDR